MAENTCSGDCLRCSIQQQMYCSAQRTYAIMRNQEAIVARLDALDSKLSAFSNQQPMIRLEGNDAQNGSGAENREPNQP